MSDNEIPAVEATDAEADAPVAEPKISPVDKMADLAQVDANYEQLRSQPKVKIRVPQVFGPQTVIINGARFNVPSNVFVEVPEQVAQILADAGRI